jgi:hypothetical protein
LNVSFSGLHVYAIILEQISSWKRWYSREVPAIVMRKAIDALGLKKGDRVFALVKAVALDERAVGATHITAA